MTDRFWLVACVLCASTSVAAMFVAGKKDMDEIQRFVRACNGDAVRSLDGRMLCIR